jgi:hypothetical protein
LLLSLRQAAVAQEASQETDSLAAQVVAVEHGTLQNWAVQETRHLEAHLKVTMVATVAKTGAAEVVAVLVRLVLRVYYKMVVMGVLELQVQ